MYRLLLLAFISSSSIFGFSQANLRLGWHTATQKIRHRAETIFFKGGTITTPDNIDIACEYMCGNITIIASHVMIVANEFNPTTLNIEITSKHQNPITIITNTPEDEVRRKINTDQPITVIPLGKEKFKFDEKQHDTPVYKPQKSRRERQRVAAALVAASSSQRSHSPNSKRTDESSHTAQSNPDASTQTELLMGDIEAMQRELELLRLLQKTIPLASSSVIPANSPTKAVGSPTQFHRGGYDPFGSPSSLKN